ncbi:MAG: hemolysin family protein [Acidobacteria bacterium]|nr:hemolysin family protein [Acidobacteriota bacterium]MDA1235529.1 hemolysin family protein [Acidobacteriota bacterium]
MIALGIAIGIVLCGVLILSSYLNTLFIEALRLRPHPEARALEYSEEHVLPRLKVAEREGVRRYALVRQTSLILLTADATLLAAANGISFSTVAEALLTTFGSMLLFAHMVPNLLITRTSGRWALPFVPIARVSSWIIHPFVLLTGFVASVAELGNGSADDAEIDEGSELDALLDAGQEEGLFEEEDRKLIQSVVDFGDKTVREVMTARPRIIAIEANSNVEELRQLLIEEEHSRIPVYEETIDNILGFVHGRDTLEIERDRRQTMPVRDLVRPLALVPETKPIRELVRELQDTNAQMVIVVDEYGQTAGLVTMEDMIEEIVGEIRDESEPSYDVVEYPDKSIVSAGNLDLDRLEELVGFVPGDDTESTTIGGLVCEHLGQVPAPGAILVLDGISVEVLSSDGRRVRTVRVRRMVPEAVEESERVEE